MRTRHALRTFWLALALLCLPVRAQADLPVIDVTNITQTTITAIQTTISAVEAVFQSLQWVTELMPLEDIAVAGGIAEDMVLLAQLVEQAEGLSYDIGSLQAQIASLFNLETAPDTRDGLTERLAAIKTLRYQSYTTAAKVQTLLRTALRTVAHLHGLLETLSSIIGGLQGAQMNAQTQSVAAKHLANLDVQLAAFQRAETVDKLSEALILESIQKIQAKRMEDWPQ